MISARARPAAVALATSVLAACGTSRAHHSVSFHRSPVVQAQVAHEYPSPAPPRQRVAGASESPVSAVAAFVSAYINWHADGVSSDMRQLATRSVGQARAAAELAAAETAGDYELKQGGVANTGTIEAISPLPGHAGEYVVVTREVTTATATTEYQGLQPGWHVAIATVSEVGTEQWVVSGWQPQS